MERSKFPSHLPHSGTTNIVPLRPDSVAALLHDYHTTLEDIATECDIEPAYRAAIQNLDDRYRAWCDTTGDEAS